MKHAPANTFRSRQADIVRAILGDENDMPRRYQNGKLMVRDDVERPYYYIRVTVPRITESGRTKARERHVIGYTDEISRKEAMKRRAEILETVNAGRLLVASQVRFRDVAERFLKIRVPQLGFATQKKYTTQILKHILPAFGQMRMCDIDRPAVESWLAGKTEQLGWWSRVDLKGILSAIFTTARDWKLHEGDNPTEGVRIGRKRLVREKRLLTAEQMRAILAGLSDNTRFLVLLLFGTGLRISEAFGLRWSDVDIDAGTLTVRRRWYRGDLGEEGDTKSEAGCRTVQLGPLAVEFRRRYPGPQAREQFVFIGESGHEPPDDRDLLRFELRPLLRRLGLYYPGFGWHSFRRANVSWRQQVGGATPFEAMRAAGHGSVDMTYAYTLTDVEREQAQVFRMFNELMGLDEGVKQ